MKKPKNKKEVRAKIAKLLSKEKPYNPKDLRDCDARLRESLYRFVRRN